MLSVFISSFLRSNEKNITKNKNKIVEITKLLKKNSLFGDNYLLSPMFKRVCFFTSTLERRDNS